MAAERAVGVGSVRYLTEQPAAQPRQIRYPTFAPCLFNPVGNAIGGVVAGSGIGADGQFLRQAEPRPHSHR